MKPPTLRERLTGALRPERLRTAGILVLLTAAAVLIHGYHVGVEDQEVYLAAIQKRLDPSLFPFNARFFTEQMKFAVFAPAVAETARLLGSVAWSLLLWHLASIFLMLLGCWKLAAACFPSERARWAGVLLVAVMLTLPIAGTALSPADQYLNPREPAAACILLGLAACMSKRWWKAAAWMAAATLLHPLMGLFGWSLAVFLAWPAAASARQARGTAAALLPFLALGRGSAAWEEAAHARRYYFPLQWTWYEWLGLAAPMALVWWFRRIARQHGMAELEHLLSRLLAFSVFQFVIAAAMSMPPATEQLAALQPMRWLHIFYFIFLLAAGGLTGEFLLKRRAWLWVAVFAALALPMFVAQRDLFASSDHIEWPHAPRKNPWANAFLWARENTPKAAIFAIDPEYMGLPGEDNYGFRALAQRSLLAENQKDPGAATVFPALAPEWQAQVRAQQGIERFSREQFLALRSRYGVSWVVLPASAQPPLSCPYRNRSAQVCRVE